MRSAFSWQLRSFLSAMGLLVVTQIVLLGAGVSGVLRAYTGIELSRLSESAEAILLGAAPSEESFQHSGPFFVFSADREIVYSNRGKGRSISPDEYQPVTYDGSVIGYFYAEEVRFLSNVANRFFLIAIGILVLGSMGVAFAIASLSARRSARTIATAVTDLQIDLGTLRSQHAVAPREFAVNELTAMSRDLHEVSVILEGEEEYKRSWMQDISHDLRSPLSGLKGQLEGLRDGVLEAGSERFSRMLLDVDRLEGMARSIGELHSIEMLTAVDTELITADGLKEEIEPIFELALEESRSRLKWESDSTTIRANRPLLTRALTNIVSNAIVHAGPDITITITTHSDDLKSILTICNDGPSIPEEQLPRLFQRFYRGEFARSTPGSGLGLSIAAGIAARHGGSIRAENTTPSGVCFVIELPA